MVHMIYIWVYPGILSNYSMLIVVGQNVTDSGKTQAQFSLNAQEMNN